MTVPDQLTLPPDLLLQLWPAPNDPTTDARFCREQPELMRQLGAAADEARSGRTGKRQRGAA